MEEQEKILQEVQEILYNQGCNSGNNIVQEELCASNLACGKEGRQTEVVLVFYHHLSTYLLEVGLISITATLSLNLANQASFS